jgi:uncharacterized protein YfaS (alpha-2-macroglobulin family)
MAEAERMGFSIPSMFRSKWTSYQKNTARDWHFEQKFPQSANDQAYRLFSLALAGDPEKSAMNRLRETQGIPMLSKMFLSAAFSITGRPEIAGELLDMRNLGTEKDYSDYYYGSMMRDKAITLYTLILLKKEEQALPVLKSICDDLNNAGWYSTQSTAWGLMAYMKYIKSFQADKPGEAKVSISFNGEKSVSNVQQQRVVIKDLKEKEGTNNLYIENVSAKPLYINLVRKGIPVVTDATAAETC